MRLANGRCRTSRACAALGAVAWAILLALAWTPAPADAESRALDQALLSEVFPGAQSVGAPDGEPPARPAYKDGRLVGYVFSSYQVVRSQGYSAKPLDVLVGLDLDGVITGAAIVEHHEPILIIGVADSELAAFVAQYRGRDVRQAPGVSAEGAAAGGLDAVSGATISSLVINDAVLRSARAIAASRGLLGDTQAQLDFSQFAPATWPELIAEGSLRHLRVDVGQARRAVARGGGALFAEGVPPPPDDAPFLELYAGLATPARVGRNLLGDREFGKVTGGLDAADQLLFVAGRGLYSFKGRAYRKSGLFDRLELVQANRSYRFRRQDHSNLETLAIEGAPELRERALFRIAGGLGFDPSQPWRLRIQVQGVEEDGVTPFALFDLDYRLPERYRRDAGPGAAAGGGPATAEALPLWQQSWQNRPWSIAILAVGLAVLSVILVFQDVIVKHRRLYTWIRLGFLTYTLVWIGWIAGAQLSVVNVLTFLDSLMTEFHWDFFLLEPLIFLLWGYVAVALMFWGRGVFCGWLCPFGALQELLARLAEALRLPQWRVPFGLHERLWPIKYIAFIALFALFLYEPAMALKGAEIEPFKTAIVLKFHRPWPFVLYAALLLGAGLFVSRAYCRYLCPLGAALALPARVRMFEWLKRRWQCGKPCQICAQSCPVQAIHPDGRINPNECIHCLTCQMNYGDEALCPVLMERVKRRERARGGTAAAT